MKTCFLILALAVLCLNVDARPSNKTVTKRSAYGGSGYGGNVNLGRIEVVRPTISMDRTNDYSAHVVRPAPVLAAPAPVQIPVFRPTISMERTNDYSAHVVRPAPVLAAPAPVQDWTPAVSSSYGATNKVMQDTTFEIKTPVALETLEPELRNVCTEKNVGGSIVFYLPHPTKQSFYIQCDQFGHAFLKECPMGTIFTQNLVCENINDLHPVTPVVPVAPVAPLEAPKLQFDQTVGSYGQAPVFAASMDSGVIERSRVEVVQEAPEFKELCMNKNTYGAQVSAVFYIAHPTKQSSFIQCDEFGHAFLRECPSGTVFTRNFVCENINSIVETAPVVVAQPLMDRPVVSASSSSYGAAVVTAPLLSREAEVAHTVEIFQEAPEFRELCLNKNTYGAQVSTVFYIPHPTKQSFYIQCDEFGRAFLKECPRNTIFTLNLACENVDDLHAVEKQTIPVKPQLDQTVGSYGQAPVFAASETTNSISQAQVEIIQEAPEFRELCLNKNTYGAQVSTVFYIPHPTNKGMYIQCDQYSRAFLKTCPIGTIFTTRLTCEKITEVIEEFQVQAPLREQQVHTQTSYGQAIPVMNKVIERPILREQQVHTQTSYGQAIPVMNKVIERPILREQQVHTQTSYGQAIPVMNKVIERPILREQFVQPKTVSY